jgi:hypothetical protein
MTSLPECQYHLAEMKKSCLPFRARCIPKAFAVIRCTSGAAFEQNLTGEGQTKAIRYFRESIDTDPGCAEVDPVF